QSFPTRRPSDLVQTVFSTSLCIECDACMDICPTSCITFTANGEEDELRQRLLVPANNETQDLYVSTELPTQRVMVKDEDVCLHCGLCRSEEHTSELQSRENLVCR